MPELHPAVVICITLAIVVVVNAVLIVGLTRARPGRGIAMARDAFKALRNPWAEEDAALEELGQRVRDLPAPRGERE